MKNFVYFLPGLFWMILIFTFSSQPTLIVSSVNWQDFIVRKTAHVIEYFILVLLWEMGLRKNFRLPKVNTILISAFIAVIYASTDEFHQLFVSGREGRLRDIAIDCTGILFASLYLRYGQKPRLVV